ncbi:hypothetical protein JRQ81_012128 [Phrynocephalus forsythii]|uniref:Uncharacterized protein n=1 Tax=Phrynocephalus forsythii TaxID=171643 RepID=A0A9Q1APX7_9SAUR|nr:hypothetical protein JRQ81_012128 [Phrynocephalus forsythii]
MWGQDELFIDLVYYNIVQDRSAQVHSGSPPGEKVPLKNRPRVGGATLPGVGMTLALSVESSLLPDDGVKAEEMQGSLVDLDLSRCGFSHQMTGGKREMCPLWRYLYTKSLTIQALGELSQRREVPPQKSPTNALCVRNVLPS